MDDAALEEAVLSLFELHVAASAAGGRLAIERAVELALRAVARGEATLPADSLVTVNVRKTALNMMACAGHTAELVAAPDAPLRLSALFGAAWKEDARMVSLSRRNLEVLCSRWRAGTLAIPNKDEVLYFSKITGTDARGAGARLCAFVASDVVANWPVAAVDAAALRDVKDAISALLDADARGKLFPPLPPGSSRQDNSEDPDAAVLVLAGATCGLHIPLMNRTMQQHTQLLRDLQVSRAQTDAFEALLLRLQHETFGEGFADDAAMQAVAETMREAGGAAAARAAAAVAKYGLQRCALPACAAQEPVARTYKRCSRCGQAYYCCAAHQQDDWKRHKRKDGCKKPAADAAPSA